ncbi:MAG: hypothetical protein ACTSXT_08570 [Candidatus Helarchaeota archaeon]
MANVIKYTLGIISGILLPWLFTFLSLYFLGGIDLGWYVQLDGGFGQGLAVLTFESIGFAYTLPIFGYSFVIPLLIWLITGIICGFITKKILYAVLFPLIGMIFNIVYFFTWASLFPIYPIPVDMIASMLSPLFNGFSINMILTLLLHLCWYSLILPGAILGSLIGGIIARYRL